MKTFNLFISILFALSVLLYCNAFPASSDSSGKNDQEKKDNERDLKNWNSVKNIERDIKFNGKRALDVYYDKDRKEDDVLKPVCVFIYGGSWNSGSKIKITKFGTLLEKNGYVAVIPDYILFPKGGFEDMVDDIYKSLQWTFKNIKKYGGDPKRITFGGYSAGAHLSALTLLKSVYSYQNKKEKLEPFPHELEKALLISGPYDFDDFSSAVKFLEKSDDSIVEKLAKIVFRSKNVSPTDILKKQKSNSIKSLGAKKFTLFYTSEDSIVKESSAKNFMKEMERVCPSVDMEYVYREGLLHNSLAMGVRSGDKKFEDLFMDLLTM